MTLEQRVKQLQAAMPKVEDKITQACRDATIRAVEKAAEMTPTRPNELRGTNTQSGTMKQDWAAKSKTTPEVSGNKYTTHLNNDMEYASYVNDGHRMNRHFVPGLVINQNGVLEMNPDGKGGIIVGTKTGYVPGVHMVDDAVETWRDTLKSELDGVTKMSINEELAMSVQTGERQKLLPLWDQVRRFAYQQARRWAAAGCGGITVEDLEQEAFLALLDALERWRPDAGPFLPMYALRLKAAFTLATGQRTQRDRLDPLQGCISLDAPLTDSEGDPLYLGDVIPDQRAEEELESVGERDAAALRNEAIRQALDTLPADQRRAVVLRYWWGEKVDAKAHNRAMRALRRPAVSRGLRQYMTPV